MGSQALAMQPVASEQQELFYRILFHDDRNSRHVLATRKGEAWLETSVRRPQLSNMRFNDDADHYITINGFSDRRRRTESTRQLNALFFDLDCHGAPDFVVNRIVPEALSRIKEAIESGVMPQPNMIVHSGRGLHVYYSLARSIPYRVKKGDAVVVNVNDIEYFNDTQLHLAEVIDNVIADVRCIDVDRAVFDLTRVARIPGTYNDKAQRYAELIEANENYYHLGDLNSYRLPSPAKTPKAAEKGAGKIIRFNKLMRARLTKVVELQEYRGFNCEGNRELMCFVHYNTAVQIYDRKVAKERTQAFNARFIKPLADFELRGIYNSVDSVKNLKGEKGHYLLNVSTLIKILDLTAEEIEATQFFSSKRMIERLEAKKKTKEKREARDKRICQLYVAGDMTQQQVAQAVGCSLRTVKSVLKENGLTKVRKVSEIVATAVVVDAREVHAQTRQKMRALLDEKKGNKAATGSANPWQPCLGGSAPTPAACDSPAFSPVIPLTQGGTLLSLTVPSVESGSPPRVSTS